MTHRPPNSSGSPGGRGSRSGFAKVFAWYSSRMLRREFHSLRLTRESRPQEAAGSPLVFFVNHSSWWDPMVGLYLVDRLLPERKVAVPIDQRALDKYRFFKNLGFFGVEQGTIGGAKSFLRESVNVLDDPDTLLLITPQGRFADTRERPVRFEAGLGRLGVLKAGVVFQPAAIEYAYWEEKRPEILVHVGPPVPLPADAEPRDCTSLFEKAMTNAQDHLARLSVARDAAAFHNLLLGGSGIHPAYDLWRRFRNRLQGREFKSAHGDK